MQHTDRQSIQALPYSQLIRLSALWLGALSLLFGALTTRADTPTTRPTPEQTPQEVVRIVIKALKHNRSDDEGIATVYAFASPGNKASTGPLPRFTQMIKRGFPDMLNHIAARFEPMQVTGNKAVQSVWLLSTSGSEYGYAFQLGKQSGGENDGIWMTEGVLPLGKSSSIGI